MYKMDLEISYSCRRAYLYPSAMEIYRRRPYSHHSNEIVSNMAAPWSSSFFDVLDAMFA